jgi:predicted CXXCH cytochrome family protein
MISWRANFTVSSIGLCQECHDSMVDGGVVVHEAVSDGSCTDCHTPHASKNSPLLLSDQSSLCGECHEIAGEYDKVLHTAITDGECTDCHGAHTAPHPKLLLASYNTDRYPGPFTPEKFALCFECHDTSLVTGRGEDDVTNFRSGKKNLHDLHVQGALEPNKYGIVKRGKARSCASCHDPHASSQPYTLVREYICATIQCYTMTYYPFEDGGKCAVGCHKPKSYHREEGATSEPQAAQ